MFQSPLTPYSFLLTPCSERVGGLFMGTPSVTLALSALTTASALSLWWHLCGRARDRQESAVKVSSMSFLQCTCKKGYYGQSFETHSYCTLCPVNHYCLGASAAPTPCMENSTTQGKLGRTNISSCVCNAGFTKKQTTKAMQ